MTYVPEAKKALYTQLSVLIFIVKIDMELYLPHKAVAQVHNLQCNITVKKSQGPYNRRLLDS